MDELTARREIELLKHELRIIIKDASLSLEERLNKVYDKVKY